TVQCRANARVCLGADDDKMPDAQTGEHALEISAVERIMEVLLDERLGLTTLELGDDLPLVAPPHDLVVGGLNPYDRHVLGTRLVEELAHIRDNGVASKGLPEHAVLDVDHEQRGVRPVLERAHHTLLAGGRAARPRTAAQWLGSALDRGRSLRAI